jgi:hypothetical protein
MRLELRGAVFWLGEEESWSGSSLSVAATGHGLECSSRQKLNMAGSRGKIGPLHSR